MGDCDKMSLHWDLLRDQCQATCRRGLTQMQRLKQSEEKLQIKLIRKLHPADFDNDFDPITDWMLKLVCDCVEVAILIPPSFEPSIDFQSSLEKLRPCMAAQVHLYHHDGGGNSEDIKTILSEMFA